MTKNIETAVSKETAVDIRTRLMPQIELLFKEHGLELDTSNVKYGDGFVLKLEASKITLGKNGINTTSAAAQRFAASWYVYDLLPNTLGNKFFVGSSEYIFLGISKGSKNPFVGRQVSTGKAFRFSKQAVDAINNGV